MKKTLKLIVLAVACGVILFGGIKLINFAFEKIENTSEESDKAINADDLTTENANGAVEQTRTTAGETSNPYSVVSSEDVSAIVDIAMPSVVSINCKVPVEQYNLFGGTSSYIAQSSGTGFLVSQSPSQLFICTNEHVIKDAQSVTVNFCDETSADAMIVGFDTSYDLAIISVDISKVSKETLSEIKIASIGNSDTVKVGSMDIAIGNSLGYGQSVTVGHISALNREINIDGTRSRPLFQTDAAINPGNSGGPLLNIFGQVIGINCAKYSGYDVEGIGYAIPINNVVTTINELINSFNIDPFEAGRLAIEGKEVSEGYSVGFAMPRGVYVYGIEFGSKASESELKVGDIITKINGQEVLSFEYLEERVSHYKAGQSVTITVKRPSKNKYVEVDINVVLDALE